MMDKKKELLNFLRHHNQEHLLAFWDELSESDQEYLKNDVFALNLPQLNEYFTSALEVSKESRKLNGCLKPIAAEAFESICRLRKDQIMEYENIGLQEISASKVGVILLAGGNATRLGIGFPKGMFNVGLPSEKTLFQMFAERIVRLQNTARKHTNKSCVITWYIMTSDQTMNLTKDYFKKHNNFGLSNDSIIYFQQGTLPCFDFNGKILLSKKHQVSFAPDGNGGLYKALKTEGILDDIIKRGIEHLHAHSVDNILTKVADPLFIGYCKSKGVDCAAKVVRKTSPYEAIGVICRVNNEYRVLEYSEISKEVAEHTNDEGMLTYSAGNICNHYFSAVFLKRVCDMDSKLKVHAAKKKIPYLDTFGTQQIPKEPNGIKLEKFIFDAFELSNCFACLEVKRDEEFSALKNCDSLGVDCPSTVKDDLLGLHRKYIREAGGVVEDNVMIEISPLISYGGENLETIVKKEVFTDKTLHLTSPEEVEANKPNIESTLTLH